MYREQGTGEMKDVAVKDDCSHIGRELNCLSEREIQTLFFGQCGSSESLN